MLFKKMLAVLSALTVIGSYSVYNSVPFTASAENAVVSAYEIENASDTSSEAAEAIDEDKVEKESADNSDAEKSSTEPTTEIVASANVTSTGMIDASELFTDRDLTQTADYSEAEYYTVADGKDITINEEGVYVISGSAENVTIYIEAEDEAKVQLVLDGVDITNETMPCIYVKNSDKVFITTTETDNSLTVSGSFSAARLIHFA